VINKKAINKTIGVVTGTRADYGLLYWVMKELQCCSDVTLQVIVTGMHLAAEFGSTYQLIEADGFCIDAKVEMLLSSDTAVGVTKSMGLGIIGFADTLDQLQPDLLVLLGDRFEILAAAQAALIAKIPVAHIGGGDATEGVFDESIRHCLTKLSQLHFVTTEIAARRVRQLGENPLSIYNFGSPGLDYIHKAKLNTREQLEDKLAFQLGQKNFLITFHPVTVGQEDASQQLCELLAALAEFDEDFKLIFTKSNADPQGRLLGQMVDDFVVQHDNAVVYTSLGQQLYLSTMACSDVVIGNSSSGLYEAPSFGIPTVNIGDRQQGRLQANSIVNCKPRKQDILHAIKHALGMPSNMLSS